MPPAAAIIGGSIITGALASRSARKASQAQQRGVETGIGEQRRQFDITTGQLTSAEEANRQALLTGRRQFERQVLPFAEAGRGALQEQQSLLGLGTPEDQAAAQARLTESPGQKFIRERAERSLVRNAAALGGLGGGNVRSALVQQGAGFASQIEADQFRRLQQLTAGGQTAAQNIGQSALGTAQGIGSGAINTAARQGQFGQTAASNVANLQQIGAGARASGILGQNQALQQGIGGAFTGLAQGGFFGGSPPPPSIGPQFPLNGGAGFGQNFGQNFTASAFGGG